MKIFDWHAIIMRVIVIPGRIPNRTMDEIYREKTSFILATLAEAYMDAEASEAEASKMREAARRKAKTN